MAEGGSISQPLFLPILKPYEKYFPLNTLTKGKLNLILGIEFYFGRQRTLALYLLSTKNKKLKELVESASRLKILKDKSLGIHEEIAEKGLSKLDEILVEIENLDIKVKTLLAEVSTDKSLQNELGVGGEELKTMIEEFISWDQTIRL